MISACVTMWAVVPSLAAALWALPAGSHVEVPASQITGYTSRQISTARRCCEHRKVLCTIDRSK